MQQDRLGVGQEPRPRRARGGKSEPSAGVMRAPGREGAGRARDARRRRRRGWPAPPRPASRAQSSGSAAARASSRPAPRRRPAGTCSPSTPSRDQLGHAADARADHRPAGGARLVDDQRRVLPPDRRHDDPVGLPHQPDHVGAVVGPEVLRDRRRARCEPGREVGAERRVRPAEPAVQRDAHVALALQARGGVEQHQHALVRARCCRRRRSGCAAPARRLAPRPRRRARRRSAPAGCARRRGPRRRSGRAGRRSAR